MSLCFWYSSCGFTHLHDIQMFRYPKMESTLGHCTDNAKEEWDRRMMCKGMGFCDLVDPIFKLDLVMYIIQTLHLI